MIRQAVNEVSNFFLFLFCHKKDTLLVFIRSTLQCISNDQHNICFCSDIRKRSLLLVEKKSALSSQDLCWSTSFVNFCLKELIIMHENS